MPELDFYTTCRNLSFFRSSLIYDSGRNTGEEKQETQKLRSDNIMEIDDAVDPACILQVGE